MTASRPEPNGNDRPKWDVANWLRGGQLIQMANEPVTARVVDQRLCNRIMEELLKLTEGASSVNRTGSSEWFESFFDYFEYEGTAHPRAELSTISASEAARLKLVVVAMQEACRSTPRQLSEQARESSANCSGCSGEVHEERTIFRRN